MTFFSALAFVTILTFACAESDPKHFSVPNTFPNLTGCLAGLLTFSCENTTAIQNTCCSPTPGGLVLQTQFWDTWTGFEREGQLLPKGSWTIHGLWPDNCDGYASVSLLWSCTHLWRRSFDQYCDLSRQFDPNPSPAKLGDGTVIPPYKGPSVKTFIEDFGREDLLQYSAFSEFRTTMY
jgi:ribonuclease T2